MSAFLSSTANLLGRTLLAPIAPHSLSAVHVEYLKTTSAGSTNENGFPKIETLLAATETLDPAKKPTFRPTPWLSSGHLQTVYSALADFSSIDGLEYKRRVFITPDGGTMGLDISPPALAASEEELALSNHPAKDGNPTVVCLHGLTGGSHESYVRNCFSHMTKPKSQGGCGFRGIVVNFRGCANLPVTSPQLYSALKLADIRSALLLITKLYPNSPLIGIGFSLGANILGRYLGEEGDDTPLLGAVIIGTPFDLKAGADELDYGGYLPQKYSSAMCQNLQRMAKRHKNTLALHPPYRALLDELYDPPPQPQAELDMFKEQVKNRGPRPGERTIIKSGSLKMADEIMTRHVGGLPKPYGEFPFDSADDYYKYGGCVKVISNVKRPLLCLSAQDDPIVPSSIWKGIRAVIGRNPDGTPSKNVVNGNSNVVLAWTKGGGHLGWFEGLRPKRWLHRPTSEFITALFEKTSEEQKQKMRERSRWNQEDGIDVQEVDIELIPTEALPQYTLPGEDGRASRWGDTPQGKRTTDEAKSDDTSAATVEGIAENIRQGKIDSQDMLLNSDDTGFGVEDEASTGNPKGASVLHSSLRMGWLLTRVLKEAPLVHPRHAVCGTYAEPQDLPNHSTASQGWEILQAQKMYIDASRPEVGFCELMPESRVAAVGETFRGGIDNPGEKLDKDKKQGKGGKKVIAGL